MKRRRRRRWVDQARAILQLAFGALMLVLLARSGHAQPGAALPIAHRMVVPDTLAKVSAVLPISSEFIASEQYDRWWHEIANCEGLVLPEEYSEIRFFQVNAVHFYDRDHPSLFWKDGILMARWAVAMSFPYEGVIFVALPYRDEERVVKHEMLHFLLFWNRVPIGEDQHPMPYYSTCGMTVTYYGPRTTP